jgi:hypothetical protein
MKSTIAALQREVETKDRLLYTQQNPNQLQQNPNQLNHKVQADYLSHSTFALSPSISSQQSSKSRVSKGDVEEERDFQDALRISALETRIPATQSQRPTIVIPPSRPSLPSPQL